jgi:hypothetical protein
MSVVSHYRKIPGPLAAKKILAFLEIKGWPDGFDFLIVFALVRRSVCLLPGS